MTFPFYPLGFISPTQEFFLIARQIISSSHPKECGLTSQNVRIVSLREIVLPIFFTLLHFSKTELSTKLLAQFHCKTVTWKQIVLIQERCQANRSQESYFKVCSFRKNILGSNLRDFRLDLNDDRKQRNSHQITACFPSTVLSSDF